MHGNEYNLPPDNFSSTPYRSTIITSASLSAISPHHQIEPTSSTSPLNDITINQPSRRQTIESNTFVINQPDNEDLIEYINQATESTRF